MHSAIALQVPVVRCGLNGSLTLEDSMSSWYRGCFFAFSGSCSSAIAVAVFPVNRLEELDVTDESFTTNLGDELCCSRSVAAGMCQVTPVIQVKHRFPDIKNWLPGAVFNRVAVIEAIKV